MKTPVTDSSSIIILQAGLQRYLIEALAQVFSSEFCEIFKASGLQLYLKKDSGTGVLLWFLWNS